ncbi:hypothetical protein Naga_100346g1 [Nannochloropsis gaditana]|uniref:Uncharacterized protein n=1 Tax=Nannochloropsis gaditana TaxID=72520 RepID=W7TS22_9STRA|nr:hypothetical protein Naga_100346g1 [Nannochloropsis gaditana]
MHGRHFFLQAYSSKGKMPAQFPPSLKRRMPGSLARVRRYLEESWGSLQPMDNPPGYDEALGVTAKEDKPRRWRSPLEHARTWQRAFKSWQNSFDYDKFTLEGGLGRGLVRGEAGDRADEALKNGWSPEAARVLVDGDEKEVESLVREKLRGCRTELTEEEDGSGK